MWGSTWGNCCPPPRRQGAAAPTSAGSLWPTCVSYRPTCSIWRYCTLYWLPVLFQTSSETSQIRDWRSWSFTSQVKKAQNCWFLAARLGIECREFFFSYVFMWILVKIESHFFEKIPAGSTFNLQELLIVTFHDELVVYRSAGWQRWMHIMTENWGSDDSSF